MAVFYKTGEGDIVAGPTLEAILVEIRDENSDLCEYPGEIDESALVEVSGSTKIPVVDLDGDREIEESDPIIMMKLSEAYPMAANNGDRLQVVVFSDGSASA
jgi:hypothetical protein